jgi:cobalt/nickel transport system ATP-binding protein
VPEEIVRVSCVKHTYQDQTRVDLCGLDFVAYKGERVVVLGPNGSGKTTLLYHILGLLKPDEGLVRVFGYDPAKEYAKIRQQIGVVLQNVEEQIIAPTVWDDVSFTPRQCGYPPAQVATMVEEVLSELGIGHLRHRVAHYLSGGEKRKVALAGALVLRPKLLILDEPLEGLDPKSKGELLALFNRLHDEQGVSIILTTHDVNAIPLFADTIYLLASGGHIVRQGSPRKIFSAPDHLAESNLEAPVLVRLFWDLQQRGYDLGLPLSVEDAVERLEPCLRDEGRGMRDEERGTRPSYLIPRTS